MEIILQLFLLFLSIVLHECAHGWVALLRGDRTAKNEGRLTLNPLPHIDPFGTVVLPLLQVLLTGRVFFGYAKPVPINPSAMKNPRRDILWVGLAGPLMNFILGGVAGTLVHFHVNQHLVLPGALFHSLLIFCVINLWLGLVNLVPVPPLDGSRILAGLLPRRTLPHWMTFDKIGFFILLLLMGTGFFDKVIAPVLDALVQWVTGLR
ncbi:MAG: site-2 protease family protein [Chlamydiae bacterium]|nr:site-2 protease family protein [Chlamydiota bacterium]MBI3277453.1 site-2 protease family protein [Chlamydiota bacterium]